MNQIKTKKTPHILLINPWIEDFAAYDFWAKPMGLLRIASWLQEHNLRFDYLDCLDMTHPVHSRFLPAPPERTPWGSGKYHRVPLEPPEAVSCIPRQWSGYGLPPDYVQSYLETLAPPDIILIHTSMTYWYHSSKKLTALLHRLFPRARIVLGGIYTTICPEHATKAFYPDYTHSGEGFDFLRRYFHDNWQLFLNHPKPLSLPYPVNLYSGSDLGVLSLSLGCPFQCTYCASSFLHRHFQKAPLAFLKEELLRFAQSSIRNITFYDDALLTNAHDLLLPLLKWSQREGLNFSFHISNGINVKNITPDIAHAFKENNFTTLRLGYETADIDQQEKFGGKVTNKDFNDAIKFLHDAGYSPREIGVFLLAGYPGQKKEELKQSIEYVFDHGAKPYISEYSPIPNTRLWEDSCRYSRFPLREEPLFHNSSIFPCEWKYFTRNDLYELKLYNRKRIDRDYHQGELS